MYVYTYIYICMLYAGGGFDSARSTEGDRKEALEVYELSIHYTTIHLLLLINIYDINA